MNWPQVVMAASGVVTALAALGTFSYVRQAFQDAAYSRRALDGEAHSRGLIEVVDETEERSVRNKRALQEADLRTDGGNNE